MKNIYYHGTSFDNLESILQHGISPHEPKLWNCSCDMVYAWNPASLLESEYNNDNPTYDEVHNVGVQWAFDSAQFALATANTCRAVVIEFKANDSDMGPDDSCENMDGAFQTNTIRPDQITRILVSNDLSLLKLYFIKMHIDRDLSAAEFSPEIQKIVRAISTEGIYPEDVESITEWEEHPLPAKILKAS